MKRILATMLFGATAGVVFFALWKFVPVDDWIAAAKSSDVLASRDHQESDAPRDDELPDGFAPIDQPNDNRDESKRDQTPPAPRQPSPSPAPAPPSPREDAREPAQPLIVVDDGTFASAGELDAGDRDAADDRPDSTVLNNSTPPQPEPTPQPVAGAPSDRATASASPAPPTASDIDGASLLAALERVEAAKASSTNSSGQSGTPGDADQSRDNSPPRIAGTSPPAPASQPSPRQDADFKDLNSQLDEMSKALERFNDKLKQRLNK